jgi:acetyl-CoA carboxylase biotin carboxyl carrier protein
MTEQLDGGDSAIDAGYPHEPVPDGAIVAPLTDGAASAVATGVALPPVDGADASLLSLIDRLASLLDRTDLTELEVQFGATGLVLRKPEAIAPQAVAAGGTAGATQPQDGAGTGAATPAVGAADGLPARPAVMAPLSGIWYGSPAPGTAPYVTVGGEVAVGQVIGLIEAMKLFNEIKSDKAGRVAKINAESGKLVRAKQPLIEVEPL